LKVNFKAVEVNAEKGVVRFENGAEASADIIVAADGIRVTEKSFCGDFEADSYASPLPDK
jgi:salicylate hydroxylase